MPPISKLDLPQVNRQVDRIDAHEKRLSEMEAQFKNVKFQATQLDFAHGPTTTNDLIFTWTGSTSTLSWVAGSIQDKNAGAQSLQFDKISSAAGNQHFFSIPAGSQANLSANTSYWIGWDKVHQQMIFNTNLQNLYNNFAILVVCRVTTLTASDTAVIGGGGSLGGRDFSGHVYGIGNSGQGGSGTVTSVGLSVPAEFAVAGSPVVGAGTLAVTKANQTERKVYAGPAGGAAAQPTFRLLETRDLPSAIVLGKVRGTVYSPNGNSILNAGLGDQAIQLLGTFTYQAPSATEGASGKLTAGAGAGNQASIYHSNVRGVAIGPLKYYYIRAALGSTSLINWWAGITNVNPGTTLMQTTPSTQNLCMFAWIPSVIPTNFAIVSCDGAGTPTIASSGVAADLNFHDFLILFAAGVPTFYIDGVNVGTISAHLQSSSLDCDAIATSQNTGATAGAWFFEHEWWSS
jgi:hypothetical protein